METEKLAKYLDLANHHPNAVEGDIKDICQKVLRYGFNAAFVNPHYIELCRETLGTNGKVGTVVSFPLGQEMLAIKMASARAAVTSGADELDISLNVAYIKMGKWDKVLEEMKTLVGVVREISSGKIVKFIPEVAYLTQDEIKKTAEVMAESGADFFKTGAGSIGGAPRSTSVDDVRLIRTTIGDKLKIKVTGGIHTYEKAMEFIEAGVDRIGSSKAVEIITKTTSDEAPSKGE